MRSLLYGETKQVFMLCTQEIQSMFELMLLYYKDVSQKQFEDDLAEKKAVMLMRDTDRQIVGFSTYMVLDLMIGEVKVKGFFSGDTIVHEAYRKTTILAAELGKTFLALIDKFPDVPIYWILISKGCRTYCLLPLFFNTWYPRYDSATPGEIQLIMDAFGAKKYPDQYDREKGLIVARESAEALKPGVADADTARLRNPHVRFFAQRNSNHMQGDELVCVAHCAVENFSPAFLRMIKQAEVSYD